MPSLNPLAPENVAHGSEIQLQVNSGGTYVAIAELSEVDYSADNKMEKIPVLGSRRTGERRGRFEVNGTIKGYWINGTLRAMFLGAASPSSTGNTSAIYQSAAPFTRYQIQMVTTAVYIGTVPTPTLTFVNVTLGKDAIKWTADKHTTEDVTFSAEDLLGQ